MSAAAQPAAEPAPARLGLHYERSAGAAQCLAPAALVQAVEQRLGRSVFVPAAQADLQARVRAQRVARGFRIDVELVDREGRSLGKRHLRTRARHCSALDDSLALVVSLAVDIAAAPEAPAGAEPTAEVAPEPAAAAPAALETPIEVPESSYSPRAGWQLAPALGVLVAGGLVPGLGLGGSFELELRPPAFWALWLRAALWQPRRIGAGQGVELSAQTLELGVCPLLFELAGLESRLCAQQLVGRVAMQGFGFDRDQSGSGASFALGASESLRQHFGAWFISVSGSLLAPLVQRRYFYVDGADIVLHEPAPLWAFAGVSFGLEL
ncbi:MAG TPA: hypothetical protein VFS67_07235 [Polyangiaceae bacterium]|nr:hypothetical protein [Polyangiaceae bacterium]